MKYTIKANETSNRQGKVKGFATVVFGESFKITNIAILESSEGKLFVSMPRYRSSEVDEHNKTVYKDICNLITSEFRTDLYDDIHKKYENMTEHGMVQDANIKSETEVTPFEREGSNIKGIVRIYLDDCFVINNISVIQGKDKLFVLMPSYKTNRRAG